MKLVRSCLFTPCDRIQVMKKSITLNTDYIIFDLEDSVSPNKKKDARLELINFIKSIEYNKTKKMAIRINCPISSEWGKEDLIQTTIVPNIDAIVLPKVDNVNLLNDVINYTNKPIWAMIETCKAVKNCESIADHSSVEAIVLGGNDLTKDLKAKFSNNRNHLLYSMSKIVLAARAANKLAIDAVYMNIKDNDGLQSDCILGRDLGFDGKSLIHPDQISITNQMYSPSQEEIQYAIKVIDIWNKAMAKGNIL